MTDTQPEKAGNLTSEQLTEMVSLMCSILLMAHNMIVDAIEGRPLNANRLENYYGDWTQLLMPLDALGCLIDEDILNSLEEKLRLAVARRANAEAPQPANQDREESAINALLESLKRILHWENTTQWLEPVPADMVEDARAAIAKAEGTQAA